MTLDNSPKLSKYFGYGFLLMTLTGIVFIIRDQVTNNLIYKTLVITGFALAYTGFAICALTMIKYWIDIYKYIKRKK